jgi:hypothetical protein
LIAGFAWANDSFGIIDDLEEYFKRVQEKPVLKKDTRLIKPKLSLAVVKRNLVS